MSCKALVSAYVRLRNQQALEDMRRLRRELLQVASASALEHIQRDLKLIEEGLEQLRRLRQRPPTNSAASARLHPE
ncbi:MAG: hypothetical protein C5B56_04840 [Proteobacteria bacterium]|nr:MAG: hypothetical protein C5B56_04840 [Pseudomonadota bacterium]